MDERYMEKTIGTSYWMPFTANRQFHKNPKVINSAKGLYYYTKDGAKILDGISGLWCSPLGHGREEIASAVKNQLLELDYATAFQVGHTQAYKLTDRLVEQVNKSPYTNKLKHIFFTNSGSESADTALKIALAYHKSQGNNSKIILIGREKGYHGVNFGGLSVGGIDNNKKQFGPLLQNVEHLPHLLNIEKNAFNRGFPEYGLEQASYLETLIEKHGADKIAAVIVEPFSGSAGVIVPPLGYLQKLREITKQHNILLIFDEVISGFGRVGDMFAAQRWQVEADIITTAKGLTNGAIPMGAVFISDFIYNSLMQGDDRYIELFHGYTYSGHPVACAAANACLDIFQQENIFTRVHELEQYWQDAVHSLKGLPNLIDIRNIGLAAGFEFKAPSDSFTGLYGYKIFSECFERGLLVRHSGDIIALAPPLIVNKAEIDYCIDILSESIKVVTKSI